MVGSGCDHCRPGGSSFGRISGTSEGVLVVDLSIVHESVSWTDETFWAGTRRRVTSSTALPPAAYTDPAFFDAEQTRVFERAWVNIGCSDDVRLPGRLLVRSVGQRSIIVTRGTDGVVRGFLNSCRHRGTELAEADCDIKNTIRCPYHRWGYGLDGSLKATPRFADVPRDDFDPADLSLVEVRIATWGPLLFACLDAATPPLDVWLGDLDERMAGYRLEEWQVQDEVVLDIGANWKLLTENFQEYYHLTWIHPELSKVSRVEDHYRYQGPGMYIGQTTTPVSADDRDDWLALPPAQGLDESDATSGRHLAVFPNVMMSVLPNHIAVLRLEPTSAGTTTETLTFLVPNRVEPADFAKTRDFWIDLNNEDVDICQRSQRGLTRGAVPPGPLAPRFEEPLHRFHNMVADLMCADDLQPYTPPVGDAPGDDERYGTGPNPCPPAIDR